ncbi:MAG: ABC transporter permease [Flavobacteriales bacterium]
MIILLVYKNLVSKPLNALLSLILLISGIAIISLLLHMQDQIENRLSKQIDGIDQVMGAKGSPLQLILSAVYQIDAPTGNINFQEAQRWMNHPFVQRAIPLSYGDNYLGFKIVGTTHDYFKHFEAELAEGKIFEDDFQVLIGAQVANRTGLKLGDKFESMHGGAETGDVHAHHPFTVAGVLKPSNKLIDFLILCNLNSYWLMHDEAHTHEHDDEEHDHAACDHDHEQSEKEITAVLFKFKNKMAALQWPRMIAENTNMQLASPAIEINRLFTLFGIGIEMLQYLGLGILILSALSIFIGLYNNLKDRKYEMAMIRVNGGSRFLLFALISFESLLLCIVGFAAGTVLAAMVINLLGQSSAEQYNLMIQPLQFFGMQQGMIFGLVLLLGFAAAFIPAIKAYKLNISKTLADNQ